jgi:hypothetical protein
MSGQNTGFETRKELTDFLARVMKPLFDTARGALARDGEDRK